MQAIRTKYFGPTNSRGSRIQAKCEAMTIFVDYDYALNSESNHRDACQQLLILLGWDQQPTYSPMAGGCFGDAYYWVFTSEDFSLWTFDGKRGRA